MSPPLLFIECDNGGRCAALLRVRRRSATPAGFREAQRPAAKGRGGLYDLLWKQRRHWPGDGNRSGAGRTTRHTNRSRSISWRRSIEWLTINGKKYYYGAGGQPVKWSQKIGGSLVRLQRAPVSCRRDWVTWRDGTKSYFHPDASGHATRPHWLAQLQRREVLLRQGHGHLETLEPEDRRQVVLLRLLFPHGQGLGHLEGWRQELLPSRLLRAMRPPSPAGAASTA